MNRGRRPSWSRESSPATRRNRLSKGCCGDVEGANHRRVEESTRRGGALCGDAAHFVWRDDRREQESKYHAGVPAAHEDGSARVDDEPGLHVARKDLFDVLHRDRLFRLGLDLRRSAEYRGQL